MLVLYPLFALVALVSADDSFEVGDFRTYPKVPKTATINGFADPIFDRLPECAKECVKQSTGNTPCPYWDTGCFCVMPQWSGLVAECFAKCDDANDVVKASSLAMSLCSSAGANTWMMPASVSTVLSQAAKGAVAEASATTTDDKKDAESTTEGSQTDKAAEETSKSEAKSDDAKSDAKSEAKSDEKSANVAGMAGAGFLASMIGLVSLLL
ncbi:GPI-anchored hemophore Pga7p [Diutina catenulata]